MAHTSTSHMTRTSTSFCSTLAPVNASTGQPGFVGNHVPTSDTDGVQTSASPRASACSAQSAKTILTGAQMREFQQKLDALIADRNTRLEMLKSSEKLFVFACCGYAVGAVGVGLAALAYLV
jgi:hypothetical protein